MRPGLIVCGLLTAVLPTWAQPAGAPGRAGDPVAAIDQAVTREMTAQRIPGVAVAVLRGDRVVVSKGYGRANLEHDVPVSDQTMFQSGSLGKMFTAAGVMALVEDGRLSLDVPVRTYLPEAPPAWSAITLRHLLSHTSGIPDYTGDALDYRKDYTEADLSALAYAMPLEFPPGTRWNYSNTGYVMLGVILTKTTGRPYWEFLRTRVFTPAGMPTARINTEAGIVPHRSSGYQIVDGELRHQDWVAPVLNTTADGSLLVSLRDLVAWTRAVRDRRVLSAASWTAMQTPVRLNSGRTFPYGFGWSVEQALGQRVVSHGGAWQGFKTQLTRFEGADLTVVVLANLAEADPEAIADAVAAAADPSLARPAPPATPLPDDPAVTARLRAVLDVAARGELAARDFEFVRITQVSGMRAAYARLLKDLGAPVRLEVVARGEEGDDRTFQYLVRYASATLRAHVKVGPGGGLTALGLAKTAP